MENQINRDYFIRDISIPRTNSESGSASIDSSIVKFEKEVLIKVLGYELYALFIDNPTDQRFINLSEGAVFTFDFNGKTVTRKYIGLKNSELESLIAYYVYFKHQSFNQTFSSTVGESRPKTENASPVSANQKMVCAWNNFVELSGSFESCIYFDSLDIDTYKHINANPSLFNYLLANKDVYPEWEFTPTRKINIFGI